MLVEDQVQAKVYTRDSAPCSYRQKARAKVCVFVLMPLVVVVVVLVNEVKRKVIT